MTEELILDGYWWLPDNPDNEIQGQLVFTPLIDSYFELQGDFSEEITFLDKRNYPIILGMLSNGTSVTLENCLLVNQNINFHGYPVLRFYVRRIYKGVHFDSVENICFKRVFVSFHNLNEWSDFKWLEIDKKYKPQKYSIQYTQPSPISFETDDYLISFMSGHSFNDTFSKFVIEQQTTISIESKKGQLPIGEFSQVIRYFQNFLTLAIGEPTSLIDIYGHTDSSIIEIETKKEIHNKVDIYYSSTGKDVVYKKIHKGEMLFTLQDVKDDISSMIMNWLEKGVSYAPVFNLYFSTLYNPHLYSEIKFLSIIQAIETYHRRKFGGKYQEDEEFHNNLYQDFVDVIPDGIDKSFRDSLRFGKLKYANEYSLRKRLRILIDYLAENGISIDYVSI
ncbi:MAG: HEPN domain-containing protein [Candidatus Hodarchaeales archaeon]